MTLSLPDSGVLLIVDDTPTNLKLLATLLDEVGFSVRIASDGETALERAELDPPDLILLDVMMPGIDGFEACRRLKANPQTASIPVIFMTALADTVDKVKGFSLGAVDYITKPFQREEVLARVKVHLQLATLTRTLATQNQDLKQEIHERLQAEARSHQLTQELQDLTQQLEHRVEERTAELATTLEQLQQSQLQIVHSEKMSALGQLVAGVAHEINNPAGFIRGNITLAQAAVADLIQHIQLYQQQAPAAVIHEHADDIDLDYLLSDLPRMLTSMQEGIERVCDISVSLRTFSRSDSSAKVAFNLHEGIDSSILILKHRLKANEHRPAIQVHKEYGSLPMVYCFPGQLNQVFLNLLANAIDALDELNATLSLEQIKANPNCITIQTTVSEDGQAVILRFRDNGIGMSPATQSKVFDYLFTTKPVGQGTGLGMAIAQQIIVEKHGGTLAVHSQPGQGAEFVIRLPIHAAGH